VVDERDLEAIVLGESRKPVEIFRLDHVQVSCGTQMIPTATVRVRGPDGASVTESAQGTGPVDAVCAAINRIVGEPGELVEFAVNAVTEGINAVGEVTMRVQEYAHRLPAADGAPGTRRQVFAGYGVNCDIVVASAEAYVAAINKLFAARAAHPGSPPARAAAPAEVGATA
jgi:2-isopropylmalate synthase